MRAAPGRTFKHGGAKQAEVKGALRLELMNDLRAEALLMGIGSTQVEVELVKSDLGEEVGAAVKGFQIEELIFDEAMNCLDCFPSSSF